MSQVATAFGSDVMTIHEVAAELGYEYNTVAQQYKQWGIPAERIGGRVMFYRDDVMKFKAGRKPEKYGMTTRWSLPKRDAA